MFPNCKVQKISPSIAVTLLFRSRGQSQISSHTSEAQRNSTEASALQTSNKF